MTGNTTTANDNNFSSEVLVQDVINVASIFFENSPMVLVGHRSYSVYIYK